LIIDYYSEHDDLPTRPAGNWRIVPTEAQQTLEREALREMPVNR
jgi:hypothetical protein